MRCGPVAQYSGLDFSALENPGLVCTITYISKYLLSPSAHCGIEWCLCQFLAVRVSKKRGIRGESGDREGTSANCLLLLLLSLLVTRQGNTVGQPCPA